MNRFHHPHSKGKTIPVADAVQAIEKISPRQKAVHIVVIRPETEACPHCGCEYLNRWVGEGEFKYCINCGQKMEKTR